MKDRVLVGFMLLWVVTTVVGQPVESPNPEAFLVGDWTVSHQQSDWSRAPFNRYLLVPHHASPAIDDYFPLSMSFDENGSGLYVFGSTIPGESEHEYPFLWRVTQVREAPTREYGPGFYLTVEWFAEYERIEIYTVLKVADVLVLSGLQSLIDGTTRSIARVLRQD